MDAAGYLQSLGIPLGKPGETALGRLSLTGEFDLLGGRGAVIRPKRGRLSDRYLEILASEGFAYVLLDGISPPGVYGHLAGDEEALVLLRALPVVEPARFPTSAVWSTLIRLLRTAAGQTNHALQLATGLLASKLRDERSGRDLFTPARVSTGDGVSLARLAGPAAGEVSGAGQEAMRTAAAFLAGYRVTPSNPGEAAAILEVIGRLVGERKAIAGLPSRLAFLFETPSVPAGPVLVASSTLGAQFAPIHACSSGTAILPKAMKVAQELVQLALPGARLHWGDFLDWEPDEPPTLAVIVPPLRVRLDGRSLKERFTLAVRDGRPLTRIAAEVIHLEHGIRISAERAIVIAVVPEGFLSSAAHADVRAWLLRNARLLAIVSLPSGGCFTESGMKCSVVYLQKTASPPEDYPILMMEIEDEDLRDSEKRAAIQSQRDAFLGREVSPCV